MIEVVLKRHWFTPDSTIGELKVIKDCEELFKCYILEDEARPEGVKIKKETCIPEGVYSLRITFSNRYQRYMPLVYNTDDLRVTDSRGKSWAGIRIHSGNTKKDTEGCLLTGKSRSEDFVSTSKDTFNELYPILEEHLGKNEKSCIITIINQQL